MLAQYIAIHPIMDLCLEAERKPVMSLFRWWWEHPTLDIIGSGQGKHMWREVRIRCRRYQSRKSRDRREGADDREILIS